MIMRTISLVARYLLPIILFLCQVATAESNFIISNNDQASTNSINSSLLKENIFLPVDEAFKLEAWIDSTGNTQLVWQITDKYYLYRHSFKFALSNNPNITLQPTISSGIAKHDEYFGDVEVYYHQAKVTIPLVSSGSPSNPTMILEASYQGCADAGLCYAPQTRLISFKNGQASIINPEKPPIQSDQATTGEQAYLKLLASTNLLKIIGLFFIAGLALTFTPCVLPMIPIVSSIVLGQKGFPGRKRAFALSFTYVMAMAITYAIAGMLTGYFGAELNLQMQMQSPLFLGAIAILFVLLSLSMFGVYELRLPTFIQNYLQQVSQKHTGGTYAGVAFIGLISTLIVSPCISAPLAGVLVYISSTENPLLGGLALLSLGIGMGIPLLIIGTFGTEFLPRTGQWMNQVKVFFGVLLLGVAIWMLDRLIPESLTLLLWAMLTISYGIHLGAIKAINSFSIKQPMHLVGLLTMIYGILLIAGAANGQHNPLTPIANLKQHGDNNNPDNILAKFKPIKNIDDLNLLLSQAKATNTPVMLDIYADWCIYCQVLEQQIFTSPQISTKLKQFTLARIDVTKNTKQDQTFLDHFGLFGPPGLLFFTPTNSSEMRNYRILGEVSLNQLEEHLGKVINKL